MDSIFEITHSEEYGKYLVAKTDFYESQHILTEVPLLSCPKEPREDLESDFCCVGCHKVLTPLTQKCNKCQWPVCSTKCSMNYWHESLECKIFTENSIAPDMVAYSHLKYLRAFLTKDMFPERFDKFLLLCSDVPNTNGNFKDYMDKESQSTFKFLTEKCRLEVTFEEVSRVCCIMKINSFFVPAEDMEGQTYRGYGVHELGCRLAHSCEPNLDIYFERCMTSRGIIEWNMHLCARRDIRKGDLLSISYLPECVSLDFGTAQRRKVFHEGFLFSCRCARCKDGSENGTYFSSPRCKKCKRGRLVPEKPLTSCLGQWICSNKQCHATRDAASVHAQIAALQRILRRLTMLESSDESMAYLDTFIEDKSRIELHPDHFLIFQGSLLWLLECDFTKVIMEQTQESTEIFEKVMGRLCRTIELAKRYKTTDTIAGLEIVAAKTVAAYAFKSPDCERVDCAGLDLELKLRFANIIERHIASAHKWMETQPKSLRFEQQRVDVADLRDIWKTRCDSYSQDMGDLQYQVEEGTLTQLRKLFN